VVASAWGGCCEDGGRLASVLDAAAGAGC